MERPRLRHRIGNGAVLGLVVGLVALIAGCGGQEVPERLDDFGAAPSFALTDQRGQEVRSSDLSGKVVLASFVYTNCVDICPTVTIRMRSLQERLRETDVLGEEVLLLSFSTDPARDTPAALRDYAERYQADERAWHFLTGPEETILSVIRDGFRLEAEPLPPSGSARDDHSSDQSGGHEVMHSGRIVLINAKGRIRAYYGSEDLDIEQVVRDVRALEPFWKGYYWRMEDVDAGT